MPFNVKRKYQISYEGITEEVSLSHSPINDTVTVRSKDGNRGYKADGGSCDVEIELFGKPATLHIRGGNGLSSQYYISMNDQMVAGDSPVLCSVKRDKAKSLIKLGIFTALVTIGLSFLDGDMLVFGFIPGWFVFLAGLCLSPFYFIVGIVGLMKHKA